MFGFNYSNLVDPLLKEIRINVSRLSGIKAGEKVLDICCGTGDQVFQYSMAGAIASGIDRNPNMIKLAETGKKRRGFNDAAFYLGSATEMPFTDSSFDCASISLCLHEMKREQRNKAINGMKRVVKKGGILIFVDFKVPMPANRIGFFIRVIEFIAGRDNFRCFKDYLAQGGLPGILKENQLITNKESLFLLDNLQVLVSINN